MTVRYKIEYKINVTTLV